MTLSRPYRGTRCDTYDLEGAVHVLRARAAIGERPEFHLGAAAALEIIARNSLRDQDEFMVVLDAIYNDNKEYYRVKEAE